MRTILLAAAAVLLAHAPDLHAQGGTISVGARILPREEVVVGASAGAVRMERGAGGALRVSLPVTLGHAVRPIVNTEAVAGGPACTLVADAGERGAGGWGARVRCTVPPGTAPGAAVPVRILLTPNA